MPARLYAVPASHPCAVVARALELKGLPYERVDIAPVLHKAAGRVLYGASTVPGLKLEDGRKLSGSRHILRELDKLRPDPPLMPADPELRQRAEEAEEWGDEVLQPLVRRILWTALAQKKEAILSYSEGARIVPPTPAPVVKLSAPVISWAERKINKAEDTAVQADLRALPSLLDRVDDWLERGVLGGEQVSAADLQVASGLRLLTTIDDLGPVLERPAGAFARRVFPQYPGHCPAGALPSAWLPASAGAAAAGSA